MRKATCFFCYAWNEDDEKNNNRYNKLDFLRKKIEEASYDKVEVILDKHSYPDNTDFEKKRELIKDYDLRVVFFTPDLLEIVNNINSSRFENREVVKEYKIIRELYEENKDTAFPVVLEGKKEDSLPDEFQGRNARIFENFLFKEDGKNYRISNSSKSEFRKFVGKIINTSIHNRDYKSEEYKSSSEALEKLFGITDNVMIPDSCLVTSQLYNDIRSQKYIFITGRKGSGKSTFIHNFREMDRDYYDDNYKKMIPIYAENFDYDLAYSTLFSMHNNDKDVINPYNSMCLFWKIFFVLYCIIIIRAEIEDQNIVIDEKRYKIFNKISRKLMGKLGYNVRRKPYDSVYDVNIIGSIFQASIQMIHERYNSAMNEIGNEDMLIPSFSSKFSLQSMIEKEFGVKDTTEFTRELAKCNKKILFALDGFDTHSEDFRIDTDHYDVESEEYRSRKAFEKLFFRTLLEVATNYKGKKENDKVGRSISEVMHFCIIIPKDRYDQIVKVDRDIIKKSFGTLSWSASELQELLTKRLEYLIGKIDPKYVIDNNDSENRFNKALSFFTCIPSTIEMNVNDNIMRMSLFNYILRSSFWRPRDVILTLSGIMTRAVRYDGHNWENANEKINEESVKLSVKRKADLIIEHEFINEYRNTFRNLDEVLKKLQGMNELNEVGDFRTHLKNIEFKTAFSYDMTKEENKLRVLYQLGVIGLFFTPEMAKKQHYLTNICFNFNEGLSPLNDFLKLKDNEEQSVKILFNPLFARWLNLKYNTDELIGDWDSQYIRENHSNKE